MNAHQTITCRCPSNYPQCFLVLDFRHWSGSQVLSFPWGTHFRPSAFFLSEWICLETMIWLCSSAHLLEEHTHLWWFSLSHHISLTCNSIYGHCWTVPESDSHNFCWKLSKFQVPSLAIFSWPIMSLRPSGKTYCFASDHLFRHLHCLSWLCTGPQSHVSLPCGFAFFYI